jgi:NADPH:quinone reductase-like Zn-dependent oxidoreductase
LQTCQADGAAASSATGLVALQLAKLARLRTICIVDVARYGESLLEAGADLLVDRLDTDRAVAIVRGVTGGRLRFALDTVGRDTAVKLRETLSSSGDRSHLVGLSGLPKIHRENVLHHNVPLKAFHDVPEIGESLMIWLEKLLLAQKLIAPQVELAVGGLSGVNQELDKLRNGTVTGKRLVVPLQEQTVKVA